MFDTLTRPHVLVMDTRNAMVRQERRKELDQKFVSEFKYCVNGTCVDCAFLGQEFHLLCACVYMHMCVCCIHVYCWCIHVCRYVVVASGLVCACFVHS